MEFENVFDSFKMGPVPEGLVKLTTNGQLAINVGKGKYRAYNPKKKTLVNPNGFAFDFGSSFTFLLPTTHVAKGDIILIDNGTHKEPVYVLEGENEDHEIKVLSYANGSILHILPERHTLLGKQYCYSKIVSLLGKSLKNENSLLNIMLFSSIFGNKSGAKSGSSLGGFGEAFSNPMALMLLMGKNSPLGDISGSLSEETGGFFSGLADSIGSFGDEDEEEEQAAEDKPIIKIKATGDKVAVED